MKGVSFYLLSVAVVCLWVCLFLLILFGNFFGNKNDF